MFRKYEVRIMDYTKEIRKIFRRLRREGIKVKKARGGHWKVYAPDGLVICPATSRDWRVLQNTLSQLRRKGCDV